MLWQRLVVLLLALLIVKHQSEFLTNKLVEMCGDAHTETVHYTLIELQRFVRR